MLRKVKTNKYDLILIGYNDAKYGWRRNLLKLKENPEFNTPVDSCNGRCNIRGKREIYE